MSPTYANLQYQMNETFDITVVLWISCNYEKFDDCRMWLGQNQWKSKHLCRFGVDVFTPVVHNSLLILRLLIFPNTEQMQASRHYCNITMIDNNYIYLHTCLHTPLTMQCLPPFFNQNRHAAMQCADARIREYRQGDKWWAWRPRVALYWLKINVWKEFIVYQLNCPGEKHFSGVI